MRELVKEKRDAKSFDESQEILEMVFVQVYSMHDQASPSGPGG